MVLDILSKSKGLSLAVGLATTDCRQNSCTVYFLLSHNREDVINGEISLNEFSSAADVKVKSEVDTINITR